MINLRYHIVSITAVFLALGIGITLGSSLIQRYTIDTLEGRLDELGERLDRTDGENRELQGELRRRDDFDDRFADEAVALFGGHLEGVPVLVLTVQGADDDLVTTSRDSLRAAGAELSGVLAFTSRWDELSDSEIDELSDVVGRRLSNDQVARTAVIRRIAAELNDATDEPPEPEPEPDGIHVDPDGLAPDPDSPADTPPQDEVPPDATQDGADGTGVDPDAADPDAADPDVPEVVEPPVPEPDVIPALVELGYLDFLPESSATPLPAFGLRLAVVVDDSAALSPSRALLPLLDAMTLQRDRALSVVVAGPLVEVTADDDTTVLAVSELVSMVRVRPRLATAVSTVDGADSFTGQAAIVLALARDGQVGHYGLGEGAESLVPARVQ